MAVQPATRVSRVGNFVVVGGSADDASKRNIGSIINRNTGQTAADVYNAATVREPIEQGCKWTHFHNPYGNLPTLYKREKNGNLLSGVMHWHARALAAAAGLTWLDTGWETTVGNLVVNDGQYVSGYFGRLMPKANTTGSPWNWSIDISAQTDEAGASNMADLAYIRYQIGEFLDGGAAMIFSDASGQDLGTEYTPHDVSADIAPMIVAAGAHTHADYSNIFSNAYAREFGFEAMPPRSSGTWKTAYTFLCEYDTFVERYGDSDYLQPDEMASVPVIIFQNANYVDFKAAKAVLEAGWCALVKWKAMADQGFAMSELLVAAAGEGEEDFEVPPDQDHRDCSGNIAIVDGGDATGSVDVVECCEDDDGDDGDEPIGGAFGGAPLVPFSLAQSEYDSEVDESGEPSWDILNSLMFPGAGASVNIATAIVIDPGFGPWAFLDFVLDIDDDEGGDSPEDPNDPDSPDGGGDSYGGANPASAHVIVIE